MFSRRIIFISVATAIASYIAWEFSASTIDLSGSGGGSGSRPHEVGDLIALFSMAIAASLSAYLSCKLFLREKANAGKGALAGLLTVAMSFFFFGVVYGFSDISTALIGGVIFLVVGSVYLGWLVYPLGAVLGAVIWFRAA